MNFREWVVYCRIVVAEIIVVDNYRTFTNFFTT